MNSKRTMHPNREQGQTLVIAVIILGILLILGTAFAGIVSRNITEAGRAAQRTVGTDLAEAGARLAHTQLLNSELGADWRPALTPPSVTGDDTRDPDALYLRPASAIPWSATMADNGGPDGLGAYSRVFYEKGRVLVRVRYAPGDFGAVGNPTGLLREPGLAQNLIVIETVGRPGSITTNGRIDPSRALSESIQIQNYASVAARDAALGRLKAIDVGFADTKKLMAFASIGLLEHARYITNKFNVSRAAEIGFPLASNNAAAPVIDQVGLNVEYGGQLVGYDGGGTPQTNFSTYGTGAPGAVPGASSGWANVPGGGSLWSNADLTIFGQNRLILNSGLGERWAVAGEIRPANNLASFLVTRYSYDRGGDQWTPTWNAVNTAATPVAIGANQLDSRSVNFSTVGSIVRDAFTTPDSEGFPRAIGRKEPPTTLRVDPQTGQTRYVTMTRSSGAFVNGRNIGRFGLGRNIYVDSPERGNISDDNRSDFGAVRNLPSDWLNPNRAESKGWMGPFYVPIAPYLRLRPDGFEIIRDNRSASPVWRNANGGNTGSSIARFRVRSVEYPVGSGVFRPFILNSIQHAALVSLPAVSLSDADFRNNGQPFDGVIFFEGDVRVRGVIPTDHQLTVVADGTIYIEGSVTKGVVQENGATLQRPSRSAIALMARDHIAVNTTMFFGPAPGETVSAKSASPLPETPNPYELVVGANETATMETEFLLDPAANPNNPATWRTYAETYADAGSGTNYGNWLLTPTAADDNGPAFFAMDFAAQPFASAAGGSWRSMLFPTTLTFGPNVFTHNGATPFFAPAANIPMHGHTDPARNAFPRYEVLRTPLYQPGGSWAGYNLATRLLESTAGNPGGDLQLAVNDPTFLRFRLNGPGGTPNKNLVNGRTVITPHDIRIEAALYAEEGSFYVIPGDSFNGNSADTFANWQTLGATNDERNENRWRAFGVDPTTPFYGEPVAVRVSIRGSLSENMPAPMSDQIKWKAKWGWIPGQIGSSGLQIPAAWVNESGAQPGWLTVPNFSVNYDPVLGRGQVAGAPLRGNEKGQPLPPMPRLPVSPTLMYFGEVNP